MPTMTKTKTTSRPAELKQYIGGKWIQGSADREVVSTNPADSREVLARFKSASKEDAARAIEAAQRAFPGWRDTTAPARGRILQKAAQILRARRDELAALMTREEGKILAEAKGEMDKGITLIEWFAGEGLRLGGVTMPS